MDRIKVEKAFRHKLHLVSEEGTKHRHYFLIHNNQEIAKTHISRTHPDISPDILRDMAEQLYLKLSELKGAINCPVSKEEFEEKVITGWQRKYGHSN